MRLAQGKTGHLTGPSRQDGACNSLQAQGAPEKPRSLWRPERGESTGWHPNQDPVSRWGLGSVIASVDSPGCTHAGGTPFPGPEVVDLQGQALGGCRMGIAAMAQSSGSLESLSPLLSCWVPPS